MASNAIFIVILVVLFMIGVLVLPQLMVLRAIPSVIRIFRQHNAVDIKSAKTVNELGLAPRGLVERMWKPRDHKPRALQALMGANIVQMTEDGRVYLSRENLAATRWSKHWSGVSMG